jgi:hypothetical protein
LLQFKQLQEHPGSSTNKFDAKTDKGSADLYFHYYGMLQHQQNMLQVRTTHSHAQFAMHAAATRVDRLFQQTLVPCKLVVGHSATPA